MNIRKRTVVLLVAITMMVSSFATMLLMDSSALQVSVAKVGQSIGQAAQTSPPISSDVETKFKKIKEAYEIIRNNYVLDVDDDKLLEGAIEGMINTLGDPYSEYMNPEIAKEFKVALESSFEGIGVEVTMRDGKVTVVSPIKGAPAEKAGLRANDQIVKVNGQDITGMELHQATMLIKGPKGTEAVLEIERPGLREKITVKVIRDEIPLETIHSQTIQASGKTFGYVEITSFASKTAEHFTKALAQLEKKGMDGLIIDVRGNPGGYLNAVEKIGELLVPNESIVTEIQNKSGDKMAYRSTLKQKKAYPITILVDGGSASASEILAAALQEAGKYKVIGQPSFGKGTVQSVVEMNDKSEIKLTIAKWLTPNGNWIHEKGVQPDIVVEQPDYYFSVPIQTENPLQLDMNSEQVRNLQVILTGLGYETGRNDGFFSNETKKAVEAFQSAHDLKVSGTVDEKTAIKLQEALIEKIRDPKTDRQLQKAVEHLVQEGRK